MGGIGSAVAHRAKAFGMKIQYHNRHQLPGSEENGAKYVSFEELLRTSDVLSLNLALNPSTKHIIGKEQFNAMKDGVIIVNTARGALIDEAALVDALKSGKVWTCGLDVFEEEPKIHPGLLECENAVLLPHVGTATFETQVSNVVSRLILELTLLARHGDTGAGQPEVGYQERQAADASTRTEGQGKLMIGLLVTHSPNQEKSGFLACET
jgi:lactate dehydrogenase-like 2-hydroxyacid dehydrogenase